MTLNVIFDVKKIRLYVDVFFLRLTYCFWIDGDVLPLRQTSRNRIDVPNTAILFALFDSIKIS